MTVYILWFQNDNVSVLQMTIDKDYFSFTVITELNINCRINQCSRMYLNSDSSLKSSI